VTATNSNQEALPKTICAIFQPQKRLLPAEAFPALSCLPEDIFNGFSFERVAGFDGPQRPGNRRNFRFKKSAFSIV
jgi:hypothetical protein